MYSESRMKRRRPCVELKTVSRHNNVGKQLYTFLSVALVLFFQTYLVSCELTEFSDISSAILVDGNNRGVVSAFGDFNADKHTDIFLLTDGGKPLISHIIVLSRLSHSLFHKYSFVYLQYFNVTFSMFVEFEFC